MSADIRALDQLSRELDRVAPIAAELVQRRRQRTVAAIVAVVVLLIAGSFTPPGRAIADAIGSLIGIGDSPSVDVDRDAVVIGIGGDDATRYEVVATSAEGDLRPGDNPTCLSVEFPEIGGAVGATCVTNATNRQLADGGVSMPLVVGLPSELSPASELLVEGVARPDVSSVQVRYTNISGQALDIPAKVSFLDLQLSRQIGLDQQAKVYVAFLPPDVLAAPSTPGDPLTVTAARDALGRISVTAKTKAGVDLPVTEAPHERAAALALALSAPEARFASHAELVARCRELLADGPDRGPSDPEVGACLLQLVE